MEKCAMKCVFLWTLFNFLTMIAARGANATLKDEVMATAQQMNLLKSSYLSDITRLRTEIDELKKRDPLPQPIDQKNDQLTIEWVKETTKELKNQMRAIYRQPNASTLMNQIDTLQNELNRVLVENAELSRLTHVQDTKIRRLDNSIIQVKYECRQMNSLISSLRRHYNKLFEETKENEARNLNIIRSNKNNGKVNKNPTAKDPTPKNPTPNKRRHNRKLRQQLNEVAKTQRRIDQDQKSIQVQMLEAQERLDKLEEPDWNLMTTKLSLAEVEIKYLREKLQNTTNVVSDLNKVHASVLQLREDIEEIENKEDRIFPEFRKEIAKLNVDSSRLLKEVHAENLYLKEDQDATHMSLKAMAASMSILSDQSSQDHLAIKNINASIDDLKARTKQHFSRLSDHILKTEANPGNTNITEEIPLPELMNEIKELQPIQNEYQVLVEQLPRDCSTISEPVGKFIIHPGHAPIDTWCANGSTLLQRRLNGSIEFNRKFVEYVKGFGNPASEYWMGLDAMHLLTADNCTGMRIDMTDIYGGEWYAQYDHFTVGDADTGYVLNVSGFKGNASDAFEYQNHMEFSAIDHDRDISNTHCAGNYEGGWWFSHCQHVNINGKYSLGLTWFDSGKNEWIAVAASEMRMYRTC